MPYTPDSLPRKRSSISPRPTIPASPDSNGFPTPPSALLLVVLYYRVAVKLVYDWYTIPDYSHGFLVPLFAASLSGISGRSSVPLPSGSPGPESLLVVFAIAVLILGVYGVELFTARMSFVLLMAGLIWTFFGWRHAPRASLSASGSRPCHSLSRRSFLTRSPSRCSSWPQESPATFCPCSASPRFTKAMSSNCQS